ncbi:unnamed protein product [Periconia digitata]|uniref:Uncharacterized protein n=1 Tax=Periconia digitata TaxID=1303443 RepID=A0A9W4U1I7_9PLEO|nr:unnamed protein product [Periconia digitata]
MIGDGWPRTKEHCGAICVTSHHRIFRGLLHASLFTNNKLPWYRYEETQWLILG